MYAGNEIIAFIFDLPSNPNQFYYANTLTNTKERDKEEKLWAQDKIKEENQRKKLNTMASKPKCV